MIFCRGHIWVLILSIFPNNATRPLQTTFCLDFLNNGQKTYLSWFAETAITKYHRRDSLNNRNVLCQGFGERKVLDQGMNGVDFFWGLWQKKLFQASLLGLETPIFSLGFHFIFPLDLPVSTFSLSYKDTGPIGLGPTPMTSFELV